MDKVEIVDRPDTKQRFISAQLVAEIIAASEAGRAVKVGLNGHKVGSAEASIRVAFSRRVPRDLRIVARDPKDGTLIVWAEKRTP